MLKRIKLRRLTGISKDSNATNIAVIGGGSWATALVKILSENAVKIQWWLRDKNAVKHIQKYHHNPDYLSGVQINRKKVSATNDIQEAVKSAVIVIIVVPAAFVKDAMKDISVADLKDKIVVSAVKGIIPDEHCLVTELLERQMLVPANQCAVIAGPCHAEEVALEKQSYLTIASAHQPTAEKIADLLNCRYIKTGINTDVYGVEYAAVMKNIIALACGITHGLNYGDNFQAVLVSNAMTEIRKFLNKIFPCERDLNASAYLGDLLVTAYSQFSRNRMFGNMIGRGYTVQSAQMEMNMIAEGYYAVKSIYEINRDLQVAMPITKAVYKILYEKVSPALEITILRDLLS